ncbi:isochorismate synthase [Staphylococcus pseudintermedius]|nr:isochorismate synthase [Staphylococcus pseudintermedius]
MLLKKKYDYSEEKNCNIYNHFRHSCNTSDILVGMVSFDGSKNNLFVPESVVVKKNDKKNKKLQNNKKIQSNKRIDSYSIPCESYYKDSVNRAINAIHNGEFKKIVLSRKNVITFEKKLCPYQIYSNLDANNSNGFIYYSEKDNNYFIGASPELLIRKKDNMIETNPLAGSRPKYDNDDLNELMKSELKNSKKDLLEHSLVVEYIEKKLKPICSQLHVPTCPEIIGSDKMWHLSTKIHGNLKESISSLELAQILHPTPAILGDKPEMLMRHLYDYEGYDRGFYSGYVGWMDYNGDGEWVISLRCGETENNKVSVYAGAGIVSDSNAEEEFKETEAKMQTLISSI